MPDTYEQELIARVVALELEAMASLNVAADAVPYFFHTQESWPYFTNRIAANPVADDGSEDVDFNRPLVVIRLVVAHLTGGYRGEPEGRVYEWGPPIKSYIQARTNWLQTAFGPFAGRMDGLQSARITDNGGLRVFDDGASDVIKQVGREFQLQCVFDEFVEQVYF